MSTPEPQEDAPPLRDATEELLGRPPTLGRREVSLAAGVPYADASRFWLALGFPAAGTDDTSFTDADVDALHRIVDLVRSGRVDEPLALSMTRAIGRSADRLAAWQSSLLLDVALTDHGAPDELVDDLEARMDEPLGSGVAGLSVDDTRATHVAAQRLLDLADELEPLVVYAWRRHLSATLNRLFSEGQNDGAGTRRTVGFADMVGFTTLVRRLSEQQLGRLVARFEALASDIVTAHGGRIVKMVGDEIFFAVRTPEAGAAVAADLVQAMDEDPAMPRIRVGIGTGTTVDHLGDVFGTAVNRASRITEIARPATIVVDDATAGALAAGQRFVLERLEPRPLRGLGVTGMWRVERAGSQGD